MSDKISKIIVEAFENDYPTLMDAVKQAVKKGESRANFEKFVKNIFKKDYDTSVIAQASMTAFDYYKNKQS